MEEKLASARKEVLVEIVKLAQKQGLKGSNGGWKEFLNFYDKKIGASLSDPARRSVDVLVAFLKTFSRDDDLKFFEKVLQCHSNRVVVEQFQKDSPDAESPEQRLVRLTLEHPQYPIEYSFPSHEEDWLVTKSGRKLKTLISTVMVAVDCEMVLCQDGTDALVRVCVVDRNLQVRLNEFVKPDKAVADYRTDITGIAAGDLEGVSCSLAHVQKSMKKLLSHGTILVGHSLHNDLKALKIDHPRVIDTSYVFKYENESSRRRPSLSSLCKCVLGYELRKMGSPHNCLDDAFAAMKLVLAKIEHGVDYNIPVFREEVSEVDTAKLLLHRIPVNINSKDLHNFIPGDFTIEVKANKKAQGDKYAAFAIFRSQQEANEAFEKLKGVVEEDSSGRPQKLISFQFSSGIAGGLCVRKMVSDDSLGRLSLKKRSLKDMDALGESKKLKTGPKCEELEETETDSNNSCNHLGEIERLKQELSQRDEQISRLNKIIAALTRKQGL